MRIDPKNNAIFCQYFVNSGIFVQALNNIAVPEFLAEIPPRQYGGDWINFLWKFVPADNETKKSN